MTTEENCPPNDGHGSVGSEEIPLLRSGRQLQLLRLLNAPFDCEPFEAWVAWIFDWTPDVANENCEWANQTLSSIDPYERWCRFTLAQGLQIVCKRLGLPCDADRHDQPHLLRQLFLPPLSGESLRDYMTSPNDPQRPLEFLTPVLWLLWFTKVCEIADLYEDAGVPMEERMKRAVPDLRIVGYRMLAFAWPESAFSRIETLTSLCDYLKVTSGLFDMESGLLTDPEAAALRELQEGTK